MKKFLETLWTNFKDNVTLIWKDFKCIDEYSQNNVMNVLCIVFLVLGCGNVILGCLSMQFPSLLLGIILLVIFSRLNMKNKW